jgi:hypothetical protein
LSVIFFEMNIFLILLQCPYFLWVRVIFFWFIIPYCHASGFKPSIFRMQEDGNNIFLLNSLNYTIIWPLTIYSCMLSRWPPYPRLEKLFLKWRESCGWADFRARMVKTSKKRKIPHPPLLRKGCRFITPPRTLLRKFHRYISLVCDVTQYAFHIANKIVGEENPSVLYSVLCTLFVMKNSRV